jgi:alkylated DNA nucleotide flippase Atl1
MNWQMLLNVLQAQVHAGSITTYGECSQWAFGHRDGGHAITAMLQAAARRGNSQWTNRVVFENGSLGAADAAYGQAMQLIAEGITLNGQIVDLTLCTPVILH